MVTSPMSMVFQHLRTTELLSDGARMTDGDLLERFIAGRDEAAFVALVRRYGQMVWGVCRRVLAGHQDAEDAFQATFLVLVRKATSVVPREMVGNWLYGVAHQGTWRIESSVWNGVPERGVALSITLIVQGDKLTWLDKDGMQYQEDTIKLMPDQSPRAIDNWTKGRVAPGIYSWEGEDFRWCSAGGGNDKVRPTSFASEPGSRQSLMLLRRQKE
jgi:uncharacterized protein (TIGR03067 family)